MSDSSKAKLVEELRELVNSDNIDNISITYKASGGPPEERIVQKVTLSGRDSDVESSINDEIESKLEQKRLLKIGPAERRSLFRQITLGMKDLISKEKAVFLPDSVVASLTIRIADKEFTTHFLANERDRIIQNNSIPSEIANVVKSFERIAAN